MYTDDQNSNSNVYPSGFTVIAGNYPGDATAAGFAITQAGAPSGNSWAVSTCRVRMKSTAPPTAQPTTIPSTGDGNTWVVTGVSNTWVVTGVSNTWVVIGVSFNHLGCHVMVFFGSIHQTPV